MNGEIQEAEVPYRIQEIADFLGNQSQSDFIPQMIEGIQKPGYKKHLKEHNPAEIPICHIVDDIQKVPPGFEPKKMLIQISPLAGSEPREAAHQFFYNEEKNLILCICPGQFIDRLYPGKQINGPGHRMTTLKNTPSPDVNPEIYFLTIENINLSIRKDPIPIEVLIGKPSDIKKYLHIDYLYQEAGIFARPRDVDFGQ